MERPTLAEALRVSEQNIKQLDKLLGEAQQLITSTRFVVTMATELHDKERSLEQLIKAQIFSESTGNSFARIVEARTHLDIAHRALAE